VSGGAYVEERLFQALSIPFLQPAKAAQTQQASGFQSGPKWNIIEPYA
jgi:hypothetical protein